MILSHETLAPLVGKMITVTRNDVPGALVGLLEGAWDDGSIRIASGKGKKEVIQIDQIARVTQEFLEASTGLRKTLTLAASSKEGVEGSYGPDYIPPGTPKPFCPSCGDWHFPLEGCAGVAGEDGNPSPVGVVTPSRYQWTYKGVSFDFYRLCEILGIRHHAQAHALKKVIRAGQSVKSLETDIEEAIACLTRWKQMVLEDKERV